jgi:hypothetical protein
MTFPGTRSRPAHMPNVRTGEVPDPGGSTPADHLWRLQNAVRGEYDGYRADQAAKQVNDLINSHQVGDDTASLLAAQAYWGRKSKVLDSIKDKSKLVAAVQNLVKSASPEELPVLVREASDYLESRNTPTDVLKSAYAEAIPRVKAAYANATVKARQRDLLTHNHANLQRAFQRDTPTMPLLDPATATADAYTDTAS